MLELRKLLVTVQDQMSKQSYLTLTTDILDGTETVIQVSCTAADRWPQWLSSLQITVLLKDWWHLYTGWPNDPHGPHRGVPFVVRALALLTSSQPSGAAKAIGLLISNWTVLTELHNVLFQLDQLLNLAVVLDKNVTVDEVNAAMSSFKRIIRLQLKIHRFPDIVGMFMIIVWRNRPKLLTLICKHWLKVSWCWGQRNVLHCTTVRTLEYSLQNCYTMQRDEEGNLLYF